MAAATTDSSRKQAALVLTLLALLPPSILGARTRPPSPPPHHSQGGHKRSPPPPASLPPPPPPPPPPPAADAGLVRATCNSTAYYDLCVSTLGADPTSATADVRGLSTIAVSAAAADASGGAAAADALATAAGNTTATPVDATTRALLRSCAAKYGEARDALSAARDSIAQQDYDYAAVHVSAAAEYPQVCRVLFQRQRPADYPPELADREEPLRRLCTVALDIITLLANNDTN
jgi:pectinesterase inhibitor-like protein